MITSQPLIVYPDSSSADYKLSADGEDLYKVFLMDHRPHFQKHWNMLSSVTPDARDAEPLLFIKTRPHARHTASSSLGRGNEAFRLKYQKLASQLKALEANEAGEVTIEPGAVRTAAAVISEMSKYDLAPPELSWMGDEAIIMLWMLGETKYALTVTDGELGYVVRAKGKTLRTDHSIPLGNIDILRLP
jgi:hypothetical protein